MNMNGMGVSDRNIVVWGGFGFQSLRSRDKTRERSILDTRKGRVGPNGRTRRRQSQSTERQGARIRKTGCPNLETISTRNAVRRVEKEKKKGSVNWPP